MAATSVRAMLTHKAQRPAGKCGDGNRTGRLGSVGVAGTNGSHGRSTSAPTCIRDVPPWNMMTNMCAPWPCHVQTCQSCRVSLYGSRWAVWMQCRHGAPPRGWLASWSCAVGRHKKWEHHVESIELIPKAHVISLHLLTMSKCCSALKHDFQFHHTRPYLISRNRSIVM